MNPEINSVLLGVKDIAASKKFYADGLGCPVHQDHKVFVSFNLGNGTNLGLYPAGDLVKDAGVSDGGDGGGFRGFTLNYIVDSSERVDQVIQQAEKAGGKILHPAAKVQWGGYSGTFADPDGFVWKVASNG